MSADARDVPGADDLLGICGALVRLRRRVDERSRERRETTLLLLLDEASGSLTAAALALERGERPRALDGIRQGRAALRLADEVSWIRAGAGRYERVEPGGALRRTLDPDLGQAIVDLVFVADDVASVEVEPGTGRHSDSGPKFAAEDLARLVVAAGDALREAAARAPAGAAAAREREAVTLALLRLCSEHAVAAAEAMEFDSDAEHAAREVREVSALIEAASVIAEPEAVERLRAASPPLG